MLLLRKTFLIQAFAVLLFAAAPAYARNAALNVAVVDMNMVQAKAAAPKSIREQVNAIRKKYREQIQSEEGALRKAQANLAQKQTLLSKEAFNEERRKFESQVREVQKSVQQKDMNLQNARSKAQNEIRKALREVVLELAQKKGYTLVIRREQTIVVADQYDITADVIAALNKKLPNVKVSSGN